MNNLNWWNPLDWGELAVVVAKSKSTEILTGALKDIILSSYWICLIGGLIGILLYVFGYEKGKKAPMVSIAIYIIINIIGSVLING